MTMKIDRNLKFIYVAALLRSLGIGLLGVERGPVHLHIHCHPPCWCVRRSMRWFAQVAIRCSPDLSAQMRIRSCSIANKVAPALVVTPALA